SDIGDFFAKKLKQPYRNWWSWAIDSLVYSTSSSPSPEELNGLENLAKLASQRCPSFPEPLPDYRTELEAALWWRLGEAHRRQDDSKALEWYEKTLKRLNNEAELRKDTVQTYRDVAAKLFAETKHAERIPLLNRAIELTSDY